MSRVKNPFAIKNGRITMIGDLAQTERGLKCGCICPSCKGDFIARMGEINISHFAHGIESCDEEKAYLLGIYSLLEQCLKEVKRIALPPLVIKKRILEKEIITIENIIDHIYIIKDFSESENEKVIFERCQITIDHVNIEKDNKGNITALLVSAQGKQLAIKIIPPKTVCKGSQVKSHEKLSTIVIDFSQENINLNALTTDAFMKMVIYEVERKYWISNSLVQLPYPNWSENKTVNRAFTQIIEKSKQINMAYLEMEKKLEAEQRFSFHNIESLQLIPFQSGVLPIKKIQLRRKEDYEKGYNEVKDRFEVIIEEQIRDSFGVRWLKCNKCSKVKQDSEMSDYGGKNHINDGTCTKCIQKKNS